MISQGEQPNVEEPYVASLDITTADSPNVVYENSRHNVEPTAESASKCMQAATNPRLQAMTTKRATLEATLTKLQTQRSALVADAKLPSGLPMPEIWTDEEKTKSALTTANAVIKEHIALLHRYNEIKDIGQGLMGLIAEQRGVRIARAMEDFGVSDKD